MRYAPPGPPASQPASYTITVYILYSTLLYSTLRHIYTSKTSHQTAGAGTAQAQAQPQILPPIPNPQPPTHGPLDRVMIDILNLIEIFST